MIRARLNPSAKICVRQKKLDGMVLGYAYKDDGLIEIDPRQSDREYLYTLIHEWAHMVIPSASEKTVRRLEKSLGEIIWKRGYRRTPKKPN